VILNAFIFILGHGVLVDQAHFIETLFAVVKFFFLFQQQVNDIVGAPAFAPVVRAHQQTVSTNGNAMAALIEHHLQQRIATRLLADQLPAVTTVITEQYD